MFITSELNLHRPNRFLRLLESHFNLLARASLANRLSSFSEYNFREGQILSYGEKAPSRNLERRVVVVGYGVNKPREVGVSRTRIMIFNAPNQHGEYTSAEISTPIERCAVNVGWRQEYGICNKFVMFAW